jgi:excisionase family DNA binding protein
MIFHDVDAILAAYYNHKKGGALLEELLTTEDIAKELKYHIETVRKWIREGKLKATRINRKEYRVKRSELERFLAEKQGE